MSSRNQRLRRKHPAVELNITAFMNLMVVLVPFLLMTAVFTHITILDLNLPEPGSQNAQDDKDAPFELRVSIGKDELILSDNKGGVIKQIKKLEQGHNFGLLKQTLIQIKARYSDTSNMTILSQQDTAYDDLIQVMDNARSYQTTYEGELVNAELFPNISIGDAPR